MGRPNPASPLRATLRRQRPLQVLNGYPSYTRSRTYDLQCWYESARLRASDEPTGRPGPTCLNRGRSRQVSVRRERATAEDNPYLRLPPEAPPLEHHRPKPTRTDQNQPPQTHDLQRSAVFPTKRAREIFSLQPPNHEAHSTGGRPFAEPRTPSNRAEQHRTPDRGISSAQRHFRRNTPESLCAPNAPNRRRQPTACSPREA